MEIISKQLKANSFIHIYNNANRKNNLFYFDDNYNYFLSLFFEHISPIASIYSYCLLPNNFHFLVKTKSEKEIFTYFKIEGKFPDETMTLDEIKKLSKANGLNNIDILGVLISKQFSKFFNVFTKVINKQQNRGGSLFKCTFESNEIKNNRELIECISCIHINPIEQNFTKDITTWKYNSYNAMLSNRPTKLMRVEVIDIFENIEYFIEFHNEKIKKYL